MAHQSFMNNMYMSTFITTSSNGYTEKNLAVKITTFDSKVAHTHILMKMTKIRSKNSYDFFG